MEDAGTLTGPHPTLETLLQSESSSQEMLVEAISAICEENRKVLAAIEQNNVQADVVQTRVREQTDQASAQHRQNQAQNQALQHLLRLQSQESEERLKESAERVKNQQLWNRVLGIGLTLITVGGGIGLSYFKAESESKGEAQSKEIVTSVESEIAEVESRVDLTEKKIERLGAIAIEQQVQIADSIEYIGDKIDAVHPSQKDAVEVTDYPTVEAARKKSEQIKRRRGVEKLFTPQEDPTDPFAGLQKGE